MGIERINRRSSIIGGTGLGGRQQSPLVARGPMFAGYDIPPQEVAELYKLYTQTGGANWLNKTNWFQNKTCANWYGLTVSGGRVTKIELPNNNLAGVTGFSPKPFSALTHLIANRDTSNTTLSMRFAVSDLPATVKDFRLYKTASVITGNLSEIPGTCQFFYIHETQSVIVGNLADAPNSLVYLAISDTPSSITGSLSDLGSSLIRFWASNTASVIDGGVVPVACIAIQTCYIAGTSATQASQDSIINRLYADRALFIYATPTLAIGGTNPDPTGVYQTSANPATPLEKVYALVNDQNAEGFKKWTITY